MRISSHLKLTLPGGLFHRAHQAEENLEPSSALHQAATADEAARDAPVGRHLAQVKL